MHYLTLYKYVYINKQREIRLKQNLSTTLAKKYILGNIYLFISYKTSSGNLCAKQDVVPLFLSS